ncbi:MAG: acetate kinase [Flavobacteriaceae bacterium]|nr:acetate kinase [Flavobacteriaceae bacterium]
MKILVINSGSSSIKFQLIQMPVKRVICSGMIERIGLKNSKVHFKSDEYKLEEILDISNHQIGLEKISASLLDKKTGVLKNTDEIDAVGHRVVHGGSTFSKTTLIDNDVKNMIKELFELAPLHNPPNFVGIEVSEKIFHKAKQIAVFDTAFHQTIPEVAYKYAIPNKFLDENQIRVYGFHGTSHKYVSEKANAYLKIDNSKIITIHLGNGCSMTAIENGKSVDHTLGFGPMNGLIMGTRSGDIDQSVIFYLIKSLGYTVEEVNGILQKESGMLGLTGFSDLREIESEAINGNKACQLALHMNAYRIKKYIGSYASVMNGLDAIIFTAGIGENSDYIRDLICNKMDFLGIEFDKEKNKIRSKEIRELNTNTSKVKILVVPTNEEIEIAKQTYDLLV